MPLPRDMDYTEDVHRATRQLFPACTRGSGGQQPRAGTAAGLPLSATGSRLERGAGACAGVHAGQCYWRADIRNGTGRSEIAI